MNFNHPQVGRLINESVNIYESVVRNIEGNAQAQDERAYGGVVRASKGKMVETIAKKITQAAWAGSGNDERRLKFNLCRKYKIPIKSEYVDNIADGEIRNEIRAHIQEYNIKHGTDVHVYVDDNFVLSVECKAYAENAMLKRILFDAYLIKTQFPEVQFALVQLESQLGGDYAQLSIKPHGSKSSHTLMSYMEAADLKIITLLEGERKVDRPIHKAEFYKPLEETALKNAIILIAQLLTARRDG